ncbi:MAG: SCO6745 family protein [Acidimicrobiia bacterium]
MNVDARHLWTVAEPLHALTYFAPESHEAFEAAGLRGFWRGYFAGRAAPLRAAPATVVTATFFGFHPEFVARAVPSIWSLVEPDAAIAARLEGIDRAMRNIWGADLPSHDAARAAAELRDAVERSPVAGRPLYAANTGLDWPEAPHLALWHAVTLLREHRGDGHVSVLTVAGLDACEAHVLRIADDGLPLESIQPYRGWGEADWADAATRLRDRGWLSDGGATTTEGARARAAIEAETDRLSGELVARIANPELVVTALELVTHRIMRSGTIPYPNPVGVPPPR